MIDEVPDNDNLKAAADVRIQRFMTIKGNPNSKI